MAKNEDAKMVATMLLRMDFMGTSTVQFTPENEGRDVDKREMTVGFAGDECCNGEVLAAAATL